MPGTPGNPLAPHHHAANSETDIDKTGRAGDSSMTARPAVRFVEGPVTELRAIQRTASIVLPAPVWNR